MINPQRGDVALTVNGQERILRLTLGALAALEHRLEATSLVEMVSRFEDGSFNTGDLLALVWAGLNGGGWDISFEDVGDCTIEGGPMEAARAGARLLAVTFSETS